VPDVKRTRLTACRRPPPVLDTGAEAIVERDPAYELPDHDEPDAVAQTMSLVEEQQWLVLVARRPALACLRN
jgi:hypothetical protein